MKKFKNIIFFTLSMDESNLILNHTLDWVREFAKYGENLYCFPVHAGNCRWISDNISCRELGGGTFLKKFLAVSRIIGSLKIILKNPKENLVVYHMLPIPAVVIGTILRLFGVQQALWYSHSSKKNGVCIASFVVNSIFTPTANSFPYPNSHKLNIVGHGINLKLFNQMKDEEKSVMRLSGIWTFGRISRIKRLEVLVLAIRDSQMEIKSLTCVGPIYDQDYFLFIRSLSAKYNIDLLHLEGVGKSQLAEIMRTSSITYTGNPKTLDKAALEAAISGNFVISEDLHVLEATGMKDFWVNRGFDIHPELPEQINYLSRFAEDSTSALERLRISEYVATSHSLEKLVARIIQVSLSS